MPSPDSPTPEEEARLRRLLAEARADEPLPDDVAARLDDTLADLGAERATGAAPDVVRLDHRRRRRAVVGMLAAAAVVVMAGVGLTEALTSGGSGEALQATESAEEAVGTERATADDTTADGAMADDAVTSLDQAPEDGSSLKRRDLPIRVRTVSGPLPRIAEEQLARDARRVRRSLPAGATARHDRAVLYAPEDFTCVAERWGGGTFVGVRHAGSNAVLALRQPSGQNQIVEVLQCGTGETLRSVTLAARPVR